MKIIHKYYLPVAPYSAATMPSKATILKVDYQDNDLWVWAESDVDDYDLVQVNFELHGTGEEYEDKPSRKYVGTAQHQGFVVHVFIINEEAAA